MRETLLRLLAPSTAPLDSQVAARLAHQGEWGAFCTILSRCGLAALAYQRLVDAGAVVPDDVAAWLRAQHEHTIRRNLWLLQELHVVTSQFLRQGIPTLVLKGPALGHIGVGALVRPCHDLDVLVRRCDLTPAADTLRALGFVELQGVPHRFHKVFARMRPAPESSTMVELHFDLADGGRPYAPDAAGVWTRSVSIEIHGHVFRSAELTDHLLLTIMQLPHHYFNPRLLLDIAHIVHAHGAAINWEQFILRANAWEMRVLAGSALFNAAALLQVPLPPEARGFAKPEGYVHRVQWRIARHAILDHLSPFAGGKVTDIAPCLVVDHLRIAGFMIRQKVMGRSGQHRRWDQVPVAAFRRFMTGLSSLPSLMSVAAEATINGDPAIF